MTTAPARPQSSLGPIRQVRAGVLDIGYAEAGPADGPAVVLLHGWPYDIHSFADATPLLAPAGYRVLVPFVRGHGSTRFLSRDTPRNGQQAAVAADVAAFMDALGVGAAVLAGFDWGARSAGVVAALWPERCTGLVAVSGYLIGSQAANAAPLPPEAEYAWWYQFYFATERGRAGYAANRRGFNRLIWRLASPRWDFDEETFARSAAAFDNPDHVDVVISNYRWRLALADGERRFDEVERRLAEAPPIAVPTITLEGDANGAPHPEPGAYASRFTRRYAHRTLTGGVGHNPPRRRRGHSPTPSSRSAAGREHRPDRGRDCWTETAHTGRRPVVGFRSGRRGAGLRRTTTERETLGRLLETVRRGESAALVIRGDAGMRKATLVEHCLRSAASTPRSTCGPATTSSQTAEATTAWRRHPAPA